MAVLKATRSAQYLMAASFDWNFNDTMLTTAGVSADFGITTITLSLFSVIKLPPGAVIVGGNINRTVAFDTASYAITVGDTTTSNRYLASTDIKAVGTTALLTPGFGNPTGLDILIGITNADVCTTGAASLTIFFVIAGRANEVTAGPV